MRWRRPRCPGEFEKRRPRSLKGLGLRSGRRLRRRELLRAEKARGGTPALEVFSRPQVSGKLRSVGYEVPLAFDAVVGRDLSAPQGRKDMWKQVSLDQPRVVLLSPACKAFSISRAPFWDTMDQD
eukprot:5947578-Pyramimonas_sp.AAC.1